jgi:predicted alpha/beta-hydrolase family hydrolase
VSASLLIDGQEGARVRVLLAHGAGAPMDSPFMAKAARGLAARGARVGRFEFPYMAARRTGGKSGAPDREPVLSESWKAAIAAFGNGPGLVIGGKSLGGRIASLIADEVSAGGLVCFGYPFHPPGRPEKLRTAHLEGLSTPALILQGTRDPFGTTADVAGYRLSSSIRVHWIEDGDHSFKPRASSGRTEAGNLEEAIEKAWEFCERVVGR